MPKAVIEKCYVNGGLHSGIFWTRANDPAPQGQESFASGQAVGFLTQILLAENAHRAMLAKIGCRPMLDLDMRLGAARRGDEVVDFFHRQFLAADVERKRGLRRDADEPGVLEVGAVGIAGGEAELLELADEVVDRLFFAGGAGAAALEFVGGENFRPRENARSGNFEGRVRRGERARPGQHATNEQDFETHRASVGPQRGLAIPRVREMWPLVLPR